VSGSGELSDPRAFTAVLIVSIADYSVLAISFMTEDPSSSRISPMASACVPAPVMSDR